MWLLPLRLRTKNPRSLTSMESSKLRAATVRRSPCTYMPACAREVAICVASVKPPRSGYTLISPTIKRIRAPEKSMAKASMQSVASGNITPPGIRIVAPEAIVSVAVLFFRDRSQALVAARASSIFLYGPPALDKRKSAKPTDFFGRMPFFSSSSRNTAAFFAKMACSNLRPRTSAYGD